MKNNPSSESLRYVLRNFKGHSCQVQQRRHATSYNAIQLAPILVKAANNSNLPVSSTCKTLLEVYVRGTPKAGLVQQVREAAKEMMGIGRTDSFYLLFFLILERTQVWAYGTQPNVRTQTRPKGPRKKKFGPFTKMLY